LVARNNVGHLHFFTKSSALKALDNAGYKVIDYFYTDGAIARGAESTKGKLSRLARLSLSKISKDLSARLMGGYSLMVIVK
jgi:hypothetical protein